MNILFLHGVSQELTTTKRKALEKYGKVFSPAIDYKTNYNSIELLINQYQNQKIDAVIGWSMGGFVGYYLSDAFQKPGLLFNPALASRPVSQRIPEIKTPYLNYKQIVLGSKDEVIDPKETLYFLTKNLHEYTDYHIHIRQNMNHFVDEKVFNEETESFFKQI